MNLTTPSCPFTSIGFMAAPGQNEPLRLVGETNRTVELGNSSVQWSPTECADKQVRWLVGTSFTNIQNTSYNIALNRINFSALLCKPTYRIFSGRVTLPTNKTGNVLPDIDISDQANSHQLPNVTAEHFLRKLASGEWAPALSGALYVVASGGADRPDPVGSFGLSIPSLRVATNFSDLTDLEILLKQYFRSSASQMANLALKKPQAQNITTSATIIEQRLLLRGYSFYIIEVLLLGIVIGLGIIVTISHSGYQPRDPSSIGAIITLLSANPHFASYFNGMGKSTVEEIGQKLQSTRFRTGLASTDNVPAFRIEVGNRENEGSFTPKATLPRNDTVKWYMPMAVSITGRVLLIIVIILIIVVLEVLNKLSSRTEGISLIPRNDYVHYAWNYIPASITVGIAIFLGMVDFETRTFHPYFLLRKGPSTAAQTIYQDYISKMSTVAFFRAIRNRHKAVVATSIMTFIAPFLTIFVSNLFASEELYLQYPVLIRQQDWFNVTRLQEPLFAMSSSGGQTMGSAKAQYHQLYNLSFPKWTWDDLAIPQIEISSSELSLHDSSFLKSIEKLTVELPVVRARANCTVIEKNEYAKINETMPNGKYDTIYANLTVPMGCGSDRLITEANGGNIFQLTLYATICQKAGFKCDAAQGNYAGNDWTNFFDHPPGPIGYCPQFLVTRWGVRNNNLTDLSTLACRPFVEQVKANITFNYPEFTVDESSPPQVIAGTAQYLTNITINMPSAFFDMLFNGTDAVTTDEVSGPANVGRFKNATEKLYAQILAQYIDGNRTTSGVNAAELQATIGTPAQRLVQRPVSMRIIEALLIVVILCLIVTFFTIRFKEILPKSPHSIAAVASMVADLELLKDKAIPSGSEWLSDRTMKRGGVFDGWMFNMGWWTENDNSKKFGINIGRAKQD